MGSDSWQMVLFEVKAIPLTPELSPGALKKQVALGIFGPLESVKSLYTNTSHQKNFWTVVRMENNWLAWVALGASQKLQDDVSGSRKRWVWWSCHSFSLSQKEHTWVSSLHPRGSEGQSTMNLRDTRHNPITQRMRMRWERGGHLAKGTEQVWLMFPRADSSRSKEVGTMDTWEAMINWNKSSSETPLNLCRPAFRKAEALSPAPTPGGSSLFPSSDSY